MRHDVPLAIGVTLFILGIILRGLVREHRRTVASRQQHELATRKAGTPPTPLTHLEKHGTTYATAIALLGAILAVARLLR